MYRVQLGQQLCIWDRRYTACVCVCLSLIKSWQHHQHAGEVGCRSGQGFTTAERRYRVVLDVDLMTPVSAAPSRLHRDTKTGSHFNLHRFVTVATTALCGSLIMSSFMLELNSFFPPSFLALTLLPSLVSPPPSPLLSCFPFFLTSSFLSYLLQSR